MNLVSLPPLHACRCAALAASAAAFAASGAENSPSATRAVCAPSRLQAKVGTLTKILHTTVLVNGRYVGAAPCDLVLNNDVRTDSRGEAVFRLSMAGRGTKCVVLPLARAVAYPTKKRGEKRGAVLRFVNGRIWCSTSAGNRSSFFLADQIKITRVEAIFGVDISRRVTVKVYSGSLRVNNTTLRQRKALVLSTKGTILTGPSTAAFDADDGLALAELR
jgi:hypothetical protein